MLSYKNKKIKAFSLIEMSLVLAIMGTLAGLSLPLLLEYKSTQKRQHSKENIDLVLSALGTYGAIHHRLPCPASKTSRGKAAITCTSSPLLAIGSIPYKTLGLSEAASKDGFGHPLRYAIDSQLSLHTDFYNNDSMATLVVTDHQRQNVLDLSNKKDRVALIVLSEGEAFQSAKGVFELENTAPTLTFIDAPYSSNKEAPFRHIIRWSTRNNLLTYYGKSSPLSQESPQRQKSPHHRSENSPGGKFDDVF